MQNGMSLIRNPPYRSTRRFIGRTIPDLTGFPRDRTDSTISVAGDVFTIAPVGVSFTYWYQGREVTKTGAETVTITDVEGLHYIYYDENDVLQISTTFDIDYIYIQALVAIAYWDADNNAAILLGEERHGRVMSAETHAHFHISLGTQWVTGLALDGFTIGDGSLETHAQFGHTAGQIRDEDLELDNVADTAPATISVFYKSGATGVWRRRTANNFPLIYSGDGSGYVGAAGRIPFNEFSGGNWVLTEVNTNNDFVLVHYFATNDAAQPVIAIQGQVEYGNITAAREGATTEINSIVTAGLPAAEFTPIGSVIYQTNGGYANTPNARVRETDTGDNYVDFRGFKFSSTGSPGSHAQLGDLDFISSGHTGFQPVVFEDAGDPDANDDIADTGGNGVFLTGYFWLNTTSGMLYISVDDTATAAVWREVAIQLSSPTLSNLYVPDGGEIGNAAAARLAFDSSGATDYAYFLATNVGIGTSTPANLQEIKMPAGASSGIGLQITGAGGSGNMIIGNQTGVANVFSPVIRSVASVAAGSFGLLINPEPTSDAAGHTGMQIGPRKGSAALANADVFRINNYTTRIITIPASNNVIIGGTTDRGELTVTQASTDAAEPALTIEQLDISEEAIHFIGESSAATADRTLVSASDFTTPGAIQVWVKKKVTDNRVGGLGTIDIWVPGYAIPTA